MEKQLLNIHEASGYPGIPVEDTRILRQRQKNYKIEASVTWLLDNLRFWFGEVDSPKIGRIDRITPLQDNRF